MLLEINYRVTQKKTELTKSLITPEILFSLKQKFYGIMYSLCSQHLQSFNSVQQKLFVLQPLKDMFQMPALTLQALVYTVYVCTYACLRPFSSRTAGPIWLILFSLAPSWSRDEFVQKKLARSVQPFWRSNLFSLLEKFSFSKRKDKIHLQNGWTDLADFFSA